MIKCELGNVEIDDRADGNEILTDYGLIGRAVKEYLMKEEGFSEKEALQRMEQSAIRGLLPTEEIEKELREKLGENWKEEVDKTWNKYFGNLPRQEKINDKHD